MRETKYHEGKDFEIRLSTSEERISPTRGEADVQMVTAQMESSIANP